MAHGRYIPALLVEQKNQPLLQHRLSRKANQHAYRGIRDRNHALHVQKSNDEHQDLHGTRIHEAKKAIPIGSLLQLRPRAR